MIFHGADYNYEQWLDRPDILEKDRLFMKEAGITVLSMGIFSWSFLEPEEGKYTFDWLDKAFDDLHKNGQKIMLATPSGSKPAWMSQKYPEVCQMDIHGVRAHHGFRHNHCRTSSVYRAKCAEINTKLAERYGTHPALYMWHVSNEYNGMPCCCPNCISAFREWLKKKYGTLENLNKAWWTTFWSHIFTDWNQIFPDDTSIHGMMIDWQRFTSDMTIDFFEAESAPFRRITPKIPITTNFQMPDVGLDYHEFAKHVDVVSWDNYPDWHLTGDEKGVAMTTAFFHDLCRSYKKKPFIMMESAPGAVNWKPVSKAKMPGMHVLSCLQAVAHGADSVQYFQWRQSRGGTEKFHSAVVSHLGTDDTQIFRDVSEVGKILPQLDSVCGKIDVSSAAIVYDFQNSWALDQAQLTRNEHKNYKGECIAHYSALIRAGIQCDVIGSESDFSQYKILAIPMLYMFRGDVAARIRLFVENGGTVVATYLTGIVDGTDLCFLGGTPGGNDTADGADKGLTDVFGITVESNDVLTDHEVQLIARERKTGASDARSIAELLRCGGLGAGVRTAYRVYDYTDRIRLNGADVLYRYDGGSLAGIPAVTVNSYGKGCAVYLAPRIEHSFLDGFYSELCGGCGIKPCVSWKVPEGVFVQKRGATLFVLNFTRQCQTVAGGREIAPFGVLMLNTSEPGVL